ncbi:MAG: hypothetical protein KIS78_35465 [Labilithrix sp.]|nr:hypothetical protein [Labilithrix sp.]MCW5837746.1 hypothetical protein [Labilithrix sp.]
MLRTWLPLSLALGALACGGGTSPSPTNGTEGAGDATRGGDAAASTDGLHRFCPAEGCATGQECVTANSPEGELSTCEIRCTSHAECPDGLRCNLPPVLPDSLVHVCVD